jgi:HEAT repeat protein
MSRRQRNRPERVISTSDQVDLVVARHLELFVTSDEAARQKAVTGLLALRNPMIVPSVVRLLVGLLSHADGPVRQSALASLVAIGWPAIEPLARALLHPFSQEFLETVLDALAALGGKDKIAVQMALVQVKNATQDRSLEQAIMKAIVKIEKESHARDPLTMVPVSGWKT